MNPTLLDAALCGTNEPPADSPFIIETRRMIHIRTFAIKVYLEDLRLKGIDVSSLELEVLNYEREEIAGAYQYEAARCASPTL